MIGKGFDKPGAGGPLRRRRIATHSHPRFDERSHQPGPDGSLVIDTIASERITDIVSGIARLSGRQRSKPERRDETTLDQIDNAGCATGVEETNRQSPNRENLVGAATVVARA